MDCNLAEAKKALEKAEAKFNAGDMDGAVQMALKAKRLFPNLHGLAGHLEAYRIHSAFNPKSPATTDWYGLLNVQRSCDLDSIRLRFKHLRALTHPDKNSSSAADGAFKLVYKAWEAICKDFTSSTNKTSGNTSNAGGSTSNAGGSTSNAGGSTSNAGGCGGGYNGDENEEEESRSSSYSYHPPEKPKCPECKRQCTYIDSCRTVVECRRCQLIAMRSGSGEGFMLVIRDGIANIDINGELKTNINVRGGDAELNGANGVHIHGGNNILLTRCKGVEIKGGDSIHITNCGNININGSGNISYG
ncbi:hypothetical protein KSP39_PZI001972 [Platanthera zijinensis]|uniref:J domain-containing protein n=1 Tax=Platanthera zijinensis TaxID=2320716 RepID=A0AAP0GDP5_9ASPA